MAIIVPFFGNAAQRAAIVMDFEPILAEEAKKRMLSGKKADPVPTSAQGEKGKTRDKLAEMAKVGQVRRLYLHGCKQSLHPSPFIRARDIVNQYGAPGIPTTKPLPREDARRGHFQRLDTPFNPHRNRVLRQSHSVRLAPV